MENNNEVPSKLAKAVDKIADMDILMPVHARVKKRMNELKKLSSANSRKIMRGHIAEWHTVPPTMFVANLGSTIIGGKGTISYQVYKKKGDGKELDLLTRKVRNSKGDDVEVDVSANYIIEKTVIEIIEYRKAINKEVLK